MVAALELNQIALLHDRAQTSGGTILLKLPKPGCAGEWTDVTVAEFAAEVDRVASVLASTLKSSGVSPGSVVGVLVKGRDYLHLVYTIALSRASYVPQMIPISILVDTGIISELLNQAGAKAIVYDPSFHCPVDLPRIPVTPVDTLPPHNPSSLPPIDDLSGYSDICFIYLTSGSTSGTPKLVPLTQKFVSTYYKAQFDIWLQDRKFDTQDALLKRGSICSVAPMIQYLGCLYTGSCIIYPSTEPLSTQDLFAMVDVCGLNHMGLYGTYLSPYIQAAKRDPTVLKLLQGMRSISYGGVPVSIAEDDWCFENGISLIDMYATTECGLLMSSVHGRPARYIRPLPNVSCRFDPVPDNETSDVPLFEFVLLAGSPQIPKPHLLSADGHFHSGDLFERQQDGSYLFRGRADDWIKTSGADRVDAKSIEENVRATCSDLVKDCIVVGTLRPSPALFVELHESCTEGHDRVKQTILERMHEFNIRRYTTERVTDGRLILVVEEGVLPRTMKGNLRRAAIEQQYSTRLDEVYASLLE
ncbi:hypothetical protein FB45DRAFT_1143545 [Roridomyces roridus]|uniref:AMP-dependent synthetase/ligase domain-containing protein n=1 Tax=Roridomyces roridus TaxID=1738132 RepID=A0AAD7C0A5_9AGAR|nr:hypothetical protein FB45DRAFT_1143545 [Roridomyces roridus]